MALNFYRQNARWLGAASLMNFASGFGQTFFIALFAGEIRAEFSLSHGEWGTLYAMGTLCSALLMLGAGGVADRMSARKITLIVMLMLTMACLAMAWVSVVWLLPVVVFALRFCGQGMLSHLSMVFVGRWFRRNRGKSVAVAMLGFSLCEAMFPILFVAIMFSAGWRNSWLVAALCSLLMMVVMYGLLGRERTAQSTDSQQKHDLGMGGQHWTRGQMLRHWVFWCALFAFIAQPLISTTFFFQMVHLSETKGWGLDILAALLPFYTVCSLLAMFVSGAMVDRLGVSRMMTVYLLPLCVGLVLFSVGDSLYFAVLGFICMGLSQGAGATISGAFWPEYYGTKHLGSVRAVVISGMVFATALGPLISGWLLDSAITLSSQFLFMAIYCLAASGVFLLIGSRAVLSKIA